MGEASIHYNRPEVSEELEVPTIGVSNHANLHPFHSQRMVRWVHAKWERIQQQNLVVRPGALQGLLRDCSVIEKLWVLRCKKCCQGSENGTEAAG